MARCIHGVMTTSDDSYLLPEPSSGSPFQTRLPVTTSRSCFKRFYESMFRCCRNMLRRKRSLHSRTLRLGYGPISGSHSNFVPNKFFFNNLNSF
ncbi:Hypothetical protein SRAE_1000229800 [Strongyloides ratti]|uniref:Uncharacterized protein n=1 Tax=Strongyloides ratti TaxID=34506 RepID=A0A090L2V7_STRRB|nr:Hypothetical protein SRAE_1000229800 [Strongyloides ratti]CEF64042.1 Hypothetical protein SRAE_1000229800 [Strongyloides ratti]